MRSSTTAIALWPGATGGGWGWRPAIPNGRVTKFSGRINNGFLLFFLLMMYSAPVFAAERELVGNWKLVAFQTILENEPPKDALGADPKAI